MYLPSLKKKLKNPGKTKSEKEMYKHYGYMANDRNYISDEEYKKLDEYISNNKTTSEERVRIVNALPEKFISHFLIGETYRHELSPEVIIAVVDRLQGNLGPIHHYNDNPEVYKVLIPAMSKYKSAEEIREYFKDILEYRRVTNQPEGEKPWENAQADDGVYWEDD